MYAFCFRFVVLVLKCRPLSVPLRSSDLIVMMYWDSFSKKFTCSDHDTRKRTIVQFQLFVCIRVVSAELPAAQ